MPSMIKKNQKYKIHYSGVWVGVCGVCVCGGGGGVWAGLKACCKSTLLCAHTSEKKTAE